MSRRVTGRSTRPRASPAASCAIPEAAAAPTASTRKPAWDRPFRRSKASAPWSAKITCGRSTTSGTITPAAANSKPSASSSTRSTNRYGKSDNVEDFATKSQMQTYEGVRAMYEAYSRNKYQSTGVIQWMLNNAWPSMIWHLYDYYLRPGGGYFGAKRAMEALHPIYGYDDHSIWVVSSQYEDVKGLKLTTKIYNLDMTEKFSQDNTVDAGADSTAKIFTLPDVSGLSQTYFPRAAARRLDRQTRRLEFLLALDQARNHRLGKEHLVDDPTASYADFTALSQLPKVKLKVTDRSERKGEEEITHVTLENPSKSLAFFVRLKVDKGAKGEEILPVVWEDNYISLFPGEKREVTATYRASELGAAKATVEVSGWNVQ